MEEKEALRQLQEEVAGLAQQLQQQQRHLWQLQQRLQQLAPGQPITPVPDNQANPSGSLENFIGLRLIHLVGIVVLVIGVSIGVKYAFDRNLISEVARIVLAYAAGVALFLVSWRLKRHYAAFSAILFSGAMATIYFTSYAAHVYYALLPLVAVFLFMVLLTIFTTFQAVHYNRAEIALLGLVGAYGIPFLISSNAERADLLFLYIAIINGGVLYLLVRKDWPMVGRTAQLLTWTLFIGWSVVRYVPAQKGMATAFLLFFLLLFTGMSLARAFRQRTVGQGAAWFQLLNNVAAFGAALAIYAHAPSVQQMAPIALGFTLLCGLQALIFRQFFGAHAFLTRLHLLAAIFFLVLAIVWWFDGLQVTFIWLLLAVGLFALGIWQKSKTWRLASLSLMALTLLKLLAVDSQRFTAGQKVAAYLSLGLLLLIVSFFYQKFRQRWFDS